MNNKNIEEQIYEILVDITDFVSAENVVQRKGSFFWKMNKEWCKDRAKTISNLLKQHSQMSDSVKPSSKDDKSEPQEVNEAREFEDEEEAHRTEEGYCCACSYDMAVLENKISEAKRESVEEFKTFLLKNGYGAGNWRRIMEQYVGTLFGVHILEENPSA